MIKHFLNPSSECKYSFDQKRELPNGENNFFNHYIDIFQFLFRFFILILIETIKMKNGQKINHSFMYIAFDFFFLLTTGIIYKSKKILIFRFKQNILFTLLLSFNIAELISWLFIKHQLNTQAVDSIEIKQILNNFPSLMLLFIQSVIFIFFINFFPFVKHFVKIPEITFIFQNFYYLFLFLLFLSIIRDFRNEDNQILNDLQDYHLWFKNLLWKKVIQKPEVLKASKFVKNLILVQLESYPNEFIKNAKISPNLNKYSEKFEYIAPIYSVPYSTWSIGASVLLQVGIPQIMPDTNLGLRSKHNIEYINQIRGIPDILESYGYKLEYATRGENNFMGYGSWLNSRHYKRIYTGKTDEDLFDFYTNKYLAKIDADTRNANLSNHYLNYIIPAETHTPYIQPSWCNISFPDIEYRNRCYFCEDYIIGKFIQKFLDLKMYEHTVLAVFPDHLPFFANFKIPTEELFFLFPGIEKVDSKNKIKSEITFYNFAPTIMEMIGIEKYVPEFPFASSIYVKNENSINETNEFEKHQKPDSNDLSIMYKFLHYETGKNIRRRYKMANKFKCYINETKATFYYSDKPCEQTFMGKIL